VSASTASAVSTWVASAKCEFANILYSSYQHLLAGQLGGALDPFVIAPSSE
jgi:hypothetical protein